MKENLFEEKEVVRTVEHKAKAIKWYGTYEHAILLRCSPESPVWLRRAFRSGRISIKGDYAECILCVDNGNGESNIEGECYIVYDMVTGEIIFETRY